ncbi:flap endonuclease GEN homolog 1 [Thomomys bottae]
MGVNDLWPILEPVKQHIHLQNLGGKTIAVDLSLWVCEAQTVKKMIGTVVKPHLRNLFFRISYLTQMDVKLVFVMEGEPPQLKADVISKRNQIRYGTSGKTWSQKTGRSHFKSVLKECLDMLECLGIPWVQAAGEAEAMCAYLNTAGYVDGCLTNDGDAFLYGAHTVYRNFTMNTKDPHVDCYTMSSIKSKLGLDRDALVGLAILLGCDYLPKGIPGVGKEQALKLIQILEGQSLLQRFNQWTEKSCYATSQPLVTKKLAHCSVCSHPGSHKDHERNGCKFCKSDQFCEPHDYEYCCPCEWHQSEYDRQLRGIENSIMKKACCCEGFPFHEVIQEFLVNKDKLVKVIQYQRPDLLLFQRFTLEKMEWPNHYACEKLLVLLTRYDMLERKLGRKNFNQLQPVRIVKPRIRNGVHCFEIEWEKPEHYTIEEKQPGDLGILTVEEKSLFEVAYPEIVAIYQKQKLEVKGKKQKCMKVKPKENNLPESDDVIRFQSLLTLKPMSEVFSKQNSKLNLEISSPSLLPQKPPSASLNSLLLPEDAPCLSIKDQLTPSSRLSITEPIKDANKSLISESNQPSTSSHSVCMIANLHLSTIDWEGTSFSNSPANQRATFSPDLKPERQSQLSAMSHDFENISEQLLCESEKITTNNEVLGGGLQKMSPEEHLLSDVTNIDLQYLPLKERIHTKLLYSKISAQPNAGLKTPSLPREKESHRANNNSACALHLSKDIAGNRLQDESRNSEFLKGDQLFQEECKMNTSLPYSVSNPLLKTSKPPSSAVDHSRKVDKQTTKKTVKSTVCLDKYSSDEENSPVFWKAKNTTQKVKHRTQKHNPQLKENSYHKFSNPKIHVKETELHIESYKIARNKENSFPDPAKSYPSFLKKDSDLEICLDSPLPLRQRLKLRFQKTLNES